MICSTLKLYVLKVGNEDESFKSSVREFHSVMDDVLQDFCEILVRL